MRAVARHEAVRERRVSLPGMARATPVAQRTTEGDTEASTSGQAYALAKPLPAGELVVRLATETREALEIATDKTSRQSLRIYRFPVENSQ